MKIAPGAVDIALGKKPSVTQQHGFIHAGALAAIADTAAGYAALTLMPPGAGVLTTEFKINLVAPATGERVIARGRVIKAGGRSRWRRRRSSAKPPVRRSSWHFSQRPDANEARDGVSD